VVPAAILALIMAWTGQDYFVKYQHPNGCVQDRASNTDVFSCAASGFGIAVYSLNKDVERINKVLDFYEDKTVRGWLYHWHDCNGKPIFNREISTIDTALFYCGARYAAKRVPSIKHRVDRMISRVDVNWMMRDDLFRHGMIDGNFIQCEWDENNEGVLLYRLFNKPFRPRKVRYDLPLFVYYFPVVYYRDQELVDQLRSAVAHQEKTYGYAGITSCDTENGYTFFDPRYVSPLALYGIEPFVKVKHSHPLVQSVNLKTGWCSNDRIGIEEGAAVLLREP
jgi:hypothetical protein